jgi:cyclophilin family peptidyl-prolyl cis-trans isomerase
MISNRARFVRPCLEFLEDRVVFSIGPVTTIGSFDPGTGTWYLRKSISGGGPDSATFQYGSPGWEGVTGDWTGSRRTTIGVVDPTTATWYLRNENSLGGPDAGSFQFGEPGWIPVTGDWLGIGVTGVGMFDPTTATWYLRATPDAGPADFVFQYGEPGWIPVTGNWSGNGITTSIGVVNPSTMTWYLRNENSAGGADAGQFQYGAPTWKPVTGDWNGDAATTVGVVDPVGTWYIRNENSSGLPDIRPFVYGLGGWTSVSGTWDFKDRPFTTTPLMQTSLSVQQTNVVDLSGYFSDATLADSLVRFDTSAGPVFVELYDAKAPRTVANFLDYVSTGAYNNSIFHRSSPNFILQGGGFTVSSGPSGLTPISALSPIQNEPDPINRPNVAGTIAMAKVDGNSNSATDEFFFNLGDNSSDLSTQNGGFTVFGKVLNPSDMQVVDALAAIPTQDQGSAPALPASEQGVFTQIPLQNYSGSNFPTDTTADNYALLHDIALIRQPEALVYSVDGNSNSSVVSATVLQNRLTLVGLQPGISVITVQATNKSGGQVVSSFTVTVS